MPPSMVSYFHRKATFVQVCVRDPFQPRSQGLSLPAPQSERRETLVGSGHVPPGQIRT